ncbi:MAG: hypothetical protein JRI64_00570 [Deltaproteobacteria bacterium]|nr:hypothetical protein [Deltaproteobacteria bacterium]
MLIYDDIFNWKGFGGRFKLASGKCRLKIYDLSRDRAGGLVHLKPVIVIATDHPESSMSVRSCSSHIATMVSQTFHVAPSRMQFVEYYPRKTYGKAGKNVIPEIFEAVDFTWNEDLAVYPRLRPLSPPLLKRLLALLSEDREGE